MRADHVLGALRDRGETPDELAGAVRAVRAAMLAVDVPEPDELVDTCGTGGGAVTTFNISTAAAFVAAAAGARVAKHGNRSHTSRSGSSDVLESLGVAPADPESAADTLERHRLVFLFAPAHHPAMRHLAPVPMVFLLATASVPLFGAAVLFGDPVAVQAAYWLPALGSVTLNVVANLTFLEAVRMSPLSVTVPLLSLTPVFTAVLGFAVLGERPAPLALLGIALVVIGAFWLNIEPQSSSASMETAAVPPCLPTTCSIAARYSRARPPCATITIPITPHLLPDPGPWHQTPAPGHDGE